MPVLVFRLLHTHATAEWLVTAAVAAAVSNTVGLLLLNRAAV